MTQELYRFICLKENFTILNQFVLTYEKSNAIVKNFINNDSLEVLQKYFKDYSTIHLYIFAKLYPKHYSQNNKFGVHNKKIFSLHYKECFDAKKLSVLVLKEESVPITTIEFEPKPIALDKFIILKKPPMKRILVLTARA